MKLDRKCGKCKSADLHYSEQLEIRYWAWWQWVIGWLATAIFLVAVFPFGLILLIFMIYSMCKKKRKVYSYICQECGYASKV